MKVTITRNAVRGIMLRSNGHIFSCVFTKKDGAQRTIVARLGVQSHLHGGESTTKDKPSLVTVYDMNNRGYRNININTVSELKVQGTQYTVKGK